MKLKWIVLGLIVAGGIVAAVLSQQKPAPKVAVAPPPQARPVAPVTEPISVAVPESIPEEPVNEPQVQPAPKPKPTPRPIAQAPAVNPGKEPLHDPDARDALALVGLDPDAEQYWLDAICDTSLPDNERADLMEDLNETGFADPKNLTVDDLPLITNRLRLIAQIAPQLDPFMQKHLGEAYGDLTQMYDKVTGK
jgi:hypothetical protein